MASDRQSVSKFFYLFPVAIMAKFNIYFLLGKNIKPLAAKVATLDVSLRTGEWCP